MMGELPKPLHSSAPAVKAAVEQLHILYRRVLILSHTSSRAAVRVHTVFTVLFQYKLECSRTFAWLLVHFARRYEAIRSLVILRVVATAHHCHRNQQGSLTRLGRFDDDSPTPQQRTFDQPRGELNLDRY